MDTVPPDPQPAGKVAALRDISEPLLRYMEARGVLLSIEAQEALGQIVRVMIFAAVAGTAAFTGWLLLTAGLLSVIMEETGWSWQRSSAMLGAAHLFVALVFLLALRNRIADTRWFADTLNEFKKDRAWLARQTHKP